ncbi:MAG: TlyA family RNA methyltransferase [Clostridiales bacterium]|nr:TlyA family RNA methyltransferase [Clostridiales bacterium]
MKERLDILMTARGLCPSREKAQAWLMAGSVLVDGQPAWKPGTKVDTDARIELKQDPVPYVSRGGLKLEAALDVWEINLKDAVCVDIGASTGGFTDLMLQRGAKRVYALDVGYGQLDYKLRNDARVVVMERINARYLPEGAIPEPAGFVSIDVSFISLKHILPVAARLLKRNNEESKETDSLAANSLSGSAATFAVTAASVPSIVALVKPQFEAGREQVGKGGVIRDPAVHTEVVGKARSYAEENGLSVCGVLDSPILGAKGNKEFLLWLK